jgi:hypothetical protein
LSALNSKEFPSPSEPVANIPANADTNNTKDARRTTLALHVPKDVLKRRVTFARDIGTSSVFNVQPPAKRNE